LEEVGKICVQSVCCARRRGSCVRRKLVFVSWSQVLPPARGAGRAARGADVCCCFADFL
ncbi:hypothetical protein A2U01_0067004, partial [Trifolium medium]|nr:hypothetical protein [Trifolium medium]